MTYILRALFVTVGLALLIRLGQLLVRARHPVPRTVIHAVAGLALLFMGNTLGGPFGLGLGLNWITVPVSSILGVPGVMLLWAVRYLL